MRLIITRLLQFSILLTVTGCDSNNDTNSIETRLVQDKELINSKCSKPEEINRLLLQQTWFHTEKFRNVSMVFGHYSFSYYKTPGDINNNTEGSFCINGKDLNVQYYKTTYLPNDVSFNSDSIVSISFGGNIYPLSTDTLSLIELTDKLLTIKINSNNETHTFYRKN